MISDTLQVSKDKEAGLQENIYSLFARVLSYPDPEYPQTVEACADALKSFPAVTNEFDPFASFARGRRSEELEELFIATFDMNNKRALEIGWHLYGQEYKRGLFLVKMRELMREHEVEESSELPDHLSHCLQLLSVMDSGEGHPFVQKYLLAGLRGILEGFDDENAYRHVIQSLLQVVSDQYGREKS